MYTKISINVPYPPQMLLQNTSVYVSILTLVAISVERWQAVCSPLRAPIWRTCWVLVGIWALAALLSLPEPLTVSTHPFEFRRPNFSTRVSNYLI